MVVQYKMRGQYLPFLLWSLVVKVGCVAPYTPVTCETSGSALGKPANVTCFFNGNVNNSDTEIVVVYHSFGAAKNDVGKDVLMCMGSRNQGQRQCITRDGYTYDGNSNDHLTLVIRNASETCIGQYACHVIPPDGIVIHACNLSLPENRISESETTTSSKGSDDVIDAEGIPCKETDQEDCQTKLQIVTVILVGVVMLLLLGIIANVYYRIRSNKRNTLINYHPGDEGDDPQSSRPCLPRRDGRPQPSLLQLCYCFLFGPRNTPKSTSEEANRCDHQMQSSLDTLSSPDQKKTSKAKTQSTGNIFEI